MKKTYLVLLFVGLFWSCEQDLEQAPLSSGSTVSFYTSQVDFIQAVNSIYSSLRTYPERHLNLSETRSDNLYAVSEGGVRDWDGINSFQKTISNNPYINEAWLTNLNAVHRSNLIIEQLQVNGSIITDESLRNRLEAEAKFLRAFHYFDLVRWFGPVPLTEKTLLPDEALLVPRSPVTSVYNLIIKDLQFAIENLPPTYAAKTDLGRATSYAAMGVLALVHMTRSGPDYGIEGPGLGLSEWSQASALLDKIIADGKYGTEPVYKDIFAYDKENNKEVIFDVQYVSGGLGIGASFLWLLVPEGYFNSFGLPNQGGLAIRPVSNDLLNSYESGDLRKGVSIKDGYTFNKVTETRSFFVKYVDVTKYGTGRTDWPINFIVLRYTDVLMMKAECILHSAPGTQADVDKIVNDVRTRAGLLTPLSGVTLEMLMEERRKEFAGEGLRWHDLVRSDLVETKMPLFIETEDVQGQMQDFKKEYIIYPIPQAEVDVKSGLYQQNQGY